LAFLRRRLVGAGVGANAAATAAAFVAALLLDWGCSGSVVLASPFVIECIMVAGVAVATLL